MTLKVEFEPADLKCKMGFKCKAPKTINFINTQCKIILTGVAMQE